MDCVQIVKRGNIALVLGGDLARYVLQVNGAVQVLVDALYVLPAIT